MLLVASTFIGSVYVLSEKAHVSMEWIYDFLSKKNIIRLKIFTSLLSLLFFLILFYFGFLMVEEAFTKNYSTGTVWDPPLMDTIFFNGFRSYINDTSIHS